MSGDEIYMSYGSNDAPPALPRDVRVTPHIPNYPIFPTTKTLPVFSEKKSQISSSRLRCAGPRDVAGGSMVGTMRARSAAGKSRSRTRPSGCCRRRTWRPSGPRQSGGGERERRLRGWPSSRPRAASIPSALVRRILPSHDPNGSRH
jgi:hypothetical protein